MVYLLNMAIFHGYVSHNQMVYPKFEVFDHETGQKQQHQGIEKKPRNICGDIVA